jgi:hypothetical protein
VSFWWSRLDANRDIGSRRPADGVTRLRYCQSMTTAGQFIAELQRARRHGNVSSETEQHLKHEFRKLGWDAPDPTLATAIGVEIDRMDREAAILRKLRAALFGVA